MRKTIQREVDVEVCDGCGEELFEYDDRGREPNYMYRLYYETEDERKLCRPMCERKYFDSLK